MSDSDSDIDDLKWIRIFTPSHIPPYLVEQVRDRDYSVENFYKYHEINCLCPSTNNEFRLNPFSHLYILIDKESTARGFLWFTVDPLTKDIFIQTYSVDKEFWGRGRAVKKLADHVKAIKKGGDLNKIYWVTNYPKHSEKNGFHRSKSILMEYNENEEKNGKNFDGRVDPRGEHRSSDRTTEKFHVEGGGAGERATGGECV